MDWVSIVFLLTIISKHVYYNIMFLSAAGDSAKPAIADLANDVVAVIPNKWIPVAIQLGLSMNEIEAICENKRECFFRFMAVFDHWMRTSCTPCSWETLVTALRSDSVKELDLADKLHRKICS